jgi:ribonuclease HII
VVPGLADSKLLTPAARERVFAEVTARASAHAVVVIPAAEVDRRGLQVCNLAGMRRALAALATHPDYVLTDGFAVSGLGAPALAVWKGDRVAACIAAASVLAKVTRDRIMVDLDERYPGYGFAEHKGYSTDDHMTALARLGPCAEHRFSYANVASHTPEVAGRGRAGKVVVGSGGAPGGSSVSVANCAPSHAQVRGGAESAPSHAQVRGGAEPTSGQARSGAAADRALRPGGGPRAWRAGDGLSVAGG